MAQKILPLLVSVLILSVSLCAAIYAWSEPSVAPTGGNVNAPINAGGVTQTKTGGLNIYGNFQLGDDLAALAGYGKLLYFSTPGNNTDSLWMARYNSAADRAELRVNIGDDDDDKFVIGRTYYSDGQWYPRMTVTSAGDVGIGTANPAHKFDVDGAVNGKTLCIGGECCNTWEECVALGGGGGGGGGGCKNNGLACSAGSECCTANCSGGACAPLGSDMLPQSACANTLSTGNRRIFVTAGSYKGSAYLTTAAADAICYNAALNASMPDAEAKRFYALVATADRDPMGLLTASKYWNGVKVAATTNCEWKLVGSPSTMFSNSGIQNPINHDQWGNAVAAASTVMTSFKPVDGAAILLSQSTYAGTLCANPGAKWTKKGPCGGANACTFVSCAFGACASCCDTYKHWYGNANATDTKWAYAGVWGAGASSACNDVPRALYCVEKY